MKKLPKLVFFGTEDFSAPSLEKLIARGWDIAGVITKPDSKRGRGQFFYSPAVKQIAQKHKIKVFQPLKVVEINNDLKKLKADYGVLVAYGKILPTSTLNIFAGGIINLHPSLLPRYRGPSPIEATILNGDKKAGISLMKLVPEMDAGPVYAQKEIDLSGQETRPQLYKKLAADGASFLALSLNKIADGLLPPKAQDDKKASYTKLITKEAGLMDFAKPAEALERQVRAYMGYPKSQAKVLDNQVVITKARVAQSSDDGALVLKANPGYIEILELIAPSGRTMSGADFIRGYKK